MEKNQLITYFLLTGVVFHWFLPRISGVRLKGEYASALGLGMLFRLMNIPVQEFVLTTILSRGLRSQSAAASAFTAIIAIAATLAISAALLRLLSKAFPLLLEIDSWTAAIKSAFVLTLLRLLFPH